MNSNIDFSEGYRVTSPYNVAWLLNKGFNIDRTDRVDEKMFFYFKYDEKLEKDIEEMKRDKYFNTFVRNLMSVKRMINNHKDK